MSVQRDLDLLRAYRSGDVCAIQRVLAADTATTQGPPRRQGGTMGTLGYDPYEDWPERPQRQEGGKKSTKSERPDLFARKLADVQRGLRAIGWEDGDAAELAQDLADNRYDVIKLQREVDELKRVVVSLRSRLQKEGRA